MFHKEYPLVNPTKTVSFIPCKIINLFESFVKRYQDNPVKTLLTIG